MHQPVLANVEIPRAGTAAPLVGAALSDVILEGVHPGEGALLQRFHLMVDAALFIAQRLQLSAAIVDDPNSLTETQLKRSFANGQRILWIAHPPAHHGINIHMEISVPREKL